MKHFNGKFFLYGSLIFVIFACEPVLSQGSKKDNPVSSQNCSDVTIDYTYDPSLTREERLKKMDEAFFESLKESDVCPSEFISEKTSDSAIEEGSDTQGVEGATGEESGAEQESEEEVAESSDEKDSQTPDERIKTGNKVPEDIPPAKNDDALAAQIRYAATHEPDPKKREKLWDEYRKYKGITKK